MTGWLVETLAATTGLMIAVLLPRQPARGADMLLHCLRPLVL